MAEFTTNMWRLTDIDSVNCVHTTALLRGMRFIVPQCYREKLLDEFHPSHPEIVRMKAFASLQVSGQILTYRWATVL